LLDATENRKFLLISPIFGAVASAQECTCIENSDADQRGCLGTHPFLFVKNI
jgi:hypothetical protein